MSLTRNLWSRIRGLPGTSVIAAALRYLKSVRLQPHSLRESQSNESNLVESFVSKLSIPQTFCEFGFDITEFNCSRLIRKGWSGLLLDGNPQRVLFANRVLKKDPTLDVTAQCTFLTLDNLNQTLQIFLAERRLGVLSIDVDGNDYWFLDALLPLRPALVIVEYNASFGIRPISVPYDANFERHEKHASGWYHGASLTAFCSLMALHGYSLVAVSNGGGNAFFALDELLEGSGIRPLNAGEAYRESVLRNHWSGTTAREQWGLIEHMPYIQI